MLLTFVIALNLVAQAEPSAEDRFRALVAQEWERTMAESPTWASMLGDRRWNDRWDDVGLGARDKSHARDAQVVRELQAIDRGQLSAAEQLNYDLLRRSYERRVRAFPLGIDLLAINQRDGVQLADELVSALRMETKQDFVEWIGRCRRLGEHVDQTIERLREGMRRGIVQPRVVLQRAPAQIEKQLTEQPSESPFFRPLRRFPRDVSADDRVALTMDAEAAIREHIFPAYRRFLKFIREEYLPACYPEPGCWQMPHGAEFYAECCRRHTTTDLSPDAIHELGLKEVARIRAEMEKVKEQAKFAGTLAEFFQFLRTDPQFFCKNERELLAEYQIVSKRIDPLLVRNFRTLPRIPYGVEPIPAKIAPDTTTAYYRQPAADGSRAGTYFVNLHRPETRPKWEMMALSLHEAVPGHHLQIALATEQTNLPPFRRYGEYTAYVEGWALYAESLGDELGLYDDPYSKFGQLTYEMWRAVRLVVDTGLHHRRWSRDRAIAYFRDHAPKMENDIVNEIDRYISWPGQALAYKVGELKIKELRRRAEMTLGPRFDIKAFHDEVLLSGSLPLDILEERVLAWMERQ
jgi:uncharacterized protein (DUF885 family)